MPSPETLLSITGLGKSYAGPVLSEVELELRRGEVHALVGENGAGKSTLSRILAGLTQPDRGQMALRGVPYAPRTKRDAEHHGVRMVMQELNLIGNLTVAESIFIERLPHRFGWIDYRRLNREAGEILEQVGLGGLDPSRLIRTLGVGQQQLVEIAAGLSQRCDLLILDEPTAALTDPEINRLFGQIHRLKAAGTCVLYISHRMEEIQRIGDRVSVLRDGQLIATRPGAEIPLDEIVRLMVGRELGEAFARETPPPGPVALRVQGLRRGPAVRDVSFEVHRGEILGFAGLMGSGRTETMRALFGADRKEAGEVFFHGSTTPSAVDSPRDAVRLGLALLTENRKEQGLWLPLSIRSNLTMMCLNQLSRAPGWIRPGLERDEANRWAKTLSVRCAGVEQRVVELSGGNQQKVVIAKWLFRDCDILIFDEPTRGIDVGAKFEIYQLLGRLAAQGKAIVVVSSDLKELLGLCDRIAVMSAGRLAATFRRGAWSQDQIMAAALSGYLKPATTSLS
jgi:ribose transport system ATP-binding protein